jgi:hypothetical protein
MRFHKAIRVSKAQAQEITGARSTASMTDWVVISQGESYYDVRAMTEIEIRAFVDDLARAETLAQQEATARLN